MTRTDKHSVDYLLSFHGKAMAEKLRTVPYAAIRFLRLAHQVCKQKMDPRSELLKDRICQLEQERAQRDRSHDFTFNFISASNRD